MKQSRSKSKKPSRPESGRLERSDNYAATGLFQPSENPAPDAGLPPAGRQAKAMINELRNELDARQETGAQGQVAAGAARVRPKKQHRRRH